MPFRSLFAVPLALALAAWSACAFAATITLDIEARIDTLDRLVIRDGTLQWDHPFAFGSAVGRHGGNNWPTVISTSIDGVPVMDRVEWFPEWSAPPPNEILAPERSSIFSGLMPAVTGIANVSLDSNNARGPLALFERPHVDNGYTTVVQFGDGLDDGDAWYHARLTFDTEVPPPRPQIVGWEFEATLTEVIDLHGAYPGVRAGDPVRGIFKFDAARNADLMIVTPDQTELNFRHPLWLEVGSVTIENPRDGTEFYLNQVSTKQVTEVILTNSQVDNIAGLGVHLNTGEETADATGFLSIVLAGPATQSNQTHLPAELNLEDWPFAQLDYVAFARDSQGNVFESEAFLAEIYSLTPITAPFQPADYNFDGIVDSVDHSIWKTSFGNTVDLYADGNANGTVDAADYVLWRRAYEQSIVIDETPEETAAGSFGGCSRAADRPASRLPVRPGTRSTPKALHSKAQGRSPQPNPGKRDDTKKCLRQRRYTNHNVQQARSQYIAYAGWAASQTHQRFATP